MRSKRLELQEALKNQRLSTLTKRQEALQKQKSLAKKTLDGQMENEIVTDAVDAGLNVVALEKQRLSATKPCSAFVTGSSADEIVADALEKQKSSTTKPHNGSRANKIVTDAVDERLNVDVLEKQRSAATKPCLASVNSSSAKKIVTDAVDERVNGVALEKQRSATKPCPAFVNGRREKEIVTNAAVGERLNAVALEKQKSLTIKPRIAYVHGQSKKVAVTDAVDERLNAVALEKPRSSTTKPCSQIANVSWTNEIASIAVDARLKAVDNMLDAESDIRDADTLDTWGDIKDEDADVLDSEEDSDMQMVEDQSLPTNSDEDADMLYVDEDGEMQIAEDQLLPANSDEDAYVLDADGNGDMQMQEDQSLPTNFEKVAGSSKKRKHYKVRRQVTDPHSKSNTKCTGTRKQIIFDKYGRPCDVGSEQFATDIGKIVRANCRPAIKDWRIVPNSTKEDIWKIIVAKYVVPEVYKPNILSRARVSWKNWKSHLRIEMDKHETIAEKKENMPERFITKREDWESFVDFCNTDEDRKLRAIGKKSREATEFIQSCGRKGIYRTIYELEKESPTGEVNRSEIFLDTHVSKTINDPESSSISDIKMRLIKELVEAYPEAQKDIDNDAVALVCGRDDRGHVRGMGGGVSRSKVRASATVVETLCKVQQQNRSLQSDIQLLRAQYGENTQNHTPTPSNQSASQAPDASNLPARPSFAPPDVSNSPARSRLVPPNMSDSPARSHLAPPASNSPARSRLTPPASSSPARSRLAPPASNSPGSRLAPPASSLPASSRLAPPASSLPASSCLAPPASNLPASSCFIKNFKGRTIALGSSNTAEPPTEHVYSLIIEDIFDRDAELFDKDGKLGDIRIGGVINWPKACVESNLPADSCFVRNFKRRTIAFGSFSTAADPQMEHVYRVVVKEIYDRDAELFDTDGKLGDIMIGGVINWPKACTKPCCQ